VSPLVVARTDRIGESPRSAHQSNDASVPQSRYVHTDDHRCGRTTARMQSGAPTCYPFRSGAQQLPDALSDKRCPDAMLPTGRRGRATVSEPPSIANRHR
jgi:hypothetical protein